MHLKICALLIVLVVFLAYSANGQGTKNRLKKALAKCRKQYTSVTDEEIEKFKMGNIPESTETIECFTACMLKEAKLMKNGKFIAENALIIAELANKGNQENIDKSKEVVTKCRDQVSRGTNECTFAYAIATCISKYGKEYNIKSPLTDL